LPKADSLISGAGVVISQIGLRSILTALYPMHVLVDRSGHVQQVGPTIQKLRPNEAFVERRFLDLFDLRRPRPVRLIDELLDVAGAKLHLGLRDPPKTALKGVLAPLPDRSGAVVNLSFGMSVLDAVREHALISADFAVTDLTMEMLYLVDAKSAAMERSKPSGI